MEELADGVALERDVPPLPLAPKLLHTDRSTSKGYEPCTSTGTVADMAPNAAMAR